MKTEFVTENKTILIPTDFSDICDNAINHSIDLAKEFNFSLVILHIKSNISNNNILIEAAEKKLIDFIENQKIKSKININYITSEGNIFEEINKVATQIKAVLIILGTPGKVGFQRITGSNALKVITKTNTPTLIVQKKHIRRGYHNIVFPMTNSTNDSQKVDLAISIAKAFNATIHIFPKYEPEGVGKEKIMAIVKQIKTVFDKNLVKHVDMVSNEKGKNFAKQVLDYAEQKDCDLIMIMTTDVKEQVMLDSWDEQIIFNASQIPVICINSFIEN